MPLVRINRIEERASLSSKVREVIKDESFQTYLLAVVVGIGIGLSIVL